MRRSFVPVFLLVLVAALAWGGAASAATVPTPPYETNAECLECHAAAVGGAALSKADFADTVDYSACVKCHWVRPGTPYILDHAKALYLPDCASCHNYMPTAKPWAGQVSTTYGFFASPTSLGSSAATVHAAHINGSWPQGGYAVDCDEYCKSCHGAAGCSTCHTASLTEGGHGAHVSAVDALPPDYAPASYWTASGVAETPAAASTVAYASTSVPCAASGCHPRAALLGVPSPRCASCHTTKGDEHGYGTIDHVADDGAVDGTTCSSCHSLDLSSVHGDPGAVGASCATCHPMPRKTFGPWDQTCATGGCHTAGSTAPMHAGADAAHSVSTANLLCLDCHTGTELGSIHAAAKVDATGATSCLVCHTAAGAPVTSDCTTCHFTFDAHYDELAHSSTTVGCSGEGCHAVASGLMTVHEERSADFGCFGCHNSLRAAVQDAITAGDTSCSACHGAVSGLGGHRDAHAAVPPLANADGTPNYSYTSGSTGSAPTGDCKGCHTSNLVDEHMGLVLGSPVFFPRYDANGNPLTCGTCHDQPVGSAVQAAIAGGLSACESCHPVHGPINSIHASTFVDSPEAPCADCHSANLTVVHDGGYTNTAGLTGCDVCHDLYVGMTSGAVTGADTQAAIATGNDTRCSACHAAYHTDSTAHQASSTASLECGSCHAKGQTVIDVASSALHPACATCHASERIGAISEHTAECASCHATEGADYHAAMGDAHTFGGMDGGCMTCHDQTLPEAHADYLVRYPAYDSTCALCHENAELDLTGKTADCATCHEIHGDITTLHTATASAGCVRCHDEALADGSQLSAVHAGGCSTCHNDALDLAGKTAECATCHNDAAGGIPFHTAMSTRHIGLGTSGTCEGVGCHPSRDITVIHERFVGAGAQYSQYADTCALCHLNADAGRIDWSTTTDGTCANCHGVAHDRMNHTATSDASAECAACHGSNWVPAVHNADVTAGDPTANCDTCHNNPLAGDLTWSKTTSDCEGCHAKSPAATNHYPADMHRASFEFVCVDCHYADLETEHAKASIDVTCVECHTDPSDAAIIAAGWNKDCNQCHMDSHNDKATRHASTRTDCSTSGCHESDVAVIHDGLSQLGCGTCHTGPEQLDTELTKDCTASGCHGSYHAGLPGLHTASSSAACTRCHDEVAADGSQLESLHNGVCATCHNAMIDATSKTAECATCHNTTVSPFHGTMDATHTFDGMGAGCQQAGCHLNTLPEEHAKYLGRYTGYTDTCALCHLNTEQGRIPAGATADCTSCHTVHGDIEAMHTAATSQECVGCHEAPDAMSIHVTDAGETDCALCHAAPAGRIDWSTATIECASCHGTLTPADPNHYPIAAHDASAETGCNQCHYKDMKAEHFKPTVAVSCETCHEQEVDTFTTAWDKTCAACHATNHGEKNTKHVSTTSTCGGAGCHNIGDVADIHGRSGGPGCGACHINPATPATTTACTASGCHAGVGTDHKGLHDAASVNPKGCSGCHFTNLVDEHEKLGFTCATCHSSSVAAVTAAITANDLRCKSCHPEQHGQQNWEFNPGRASLHRVSADLPGMRSSFVVNGSTYTWSLPSASTFLKTGWTTSSMMECSDCHSYTGATGPHGATMQVNIDPAYPSPFPVVAGSSRIAQLSPNSPTGMSMTDGGSTPAGVICEKCHDLSNNGSWSNIVHKEHDDRGREGGYCNHCHTGLPHGWSRPRLIGYTTDAAPYKTTSGGIQRISLKSYTPNSWQKSDCGAGCSSSRHPLSGSSWPAIDGGTTPTPTTGTVSGTVRDSTTNAAISGATVTVGTKAVTTSSTGAYTLADVAAGSYAISVTASTYDAWAGSISVTAGTTTTSDITLQKTQTAPSTSNIARTGTASASSTSSGSYAASRAIDGSTSSYWRSGSGGTQWLRVDLGAIKTFDRVVVNWDGSRYARAYRIETSLNGSTWTSQYSTSRGSGGAETITLSSASARYVRIYMTTTNDSHYRIREFEVWGN